MSSAALPRLLAPVLVLEGALAALALLLGWWWLDDPLPVRLLPVAADLPWALGASAALMLVAAAFTSDGARRVPWLERIHGRVGELLGPALAAESVGSLALVSLAAGLGEELLFRGALQPLWGLPVSAVVFGLAHALTPAYFGLALGMGLLLGWLAAATGGLFVPVVVHATYDLVALLRLRTRVLHDAEAATTVEPEPPPG